MEDSRERRPIEPEPTFAEMVDNAVRRISTSIAIAGIAIALSIYARPGPSRYEAFATERGIVRIDTRNGTVIGCEGGQCVTLVRRGQRLGPNPNIIDDDEPRPALPAPPQPAEEAAPVPPAAVPPAAGPPAPAPAPTKQ